MLVNVVDVPPLCNFILPAIVRTGPLAVAISTAGASPALAKRMKREIGELFGEPYALLARPAQRGARLGEGDAADLPGPQGVLRVDRQRRTRPDRAAARRRADVVRELILAAQRVSRRLSWRAEPGAGVSAELTHLDAARARADGRRRREAGDRTARASRGPSCACRRRPRSAVLAGDAPKGDVLGVARIAGIQAAKRTSELIPLCHPLALTFVGVEGTVDAGRRRDRADRRGTDDGSDRGRDGGADRGLGGGADRLRHGQGSRARGRDRLGGAAREVGRPLGSVAALEAE